MRMPIVAVLLACLAAGCGKPSKFTDGGTDDANTIDGGGTVIDAGVPDAKPPLPAYEVTGGAAHVAGSRFAADVQIGHGIDQRPATGASHTAEGNAAVKP
ncbi:MAG: hypothetical protein K8W52_24215 [Deltaproteobacteria bacterium]|nr:hypothetical protein [Deltaproteobacteria bacterium]